MLKRITLKKYSIFRFFAWINIFFQLLFPLSISFSPTVIAASANYPTLSQIDENENNEDEVERKIASGAVSAGNLISGDAKASNMARDMISSQASNEVQQWMNQFGNSRVTLSLDEKAQLKNSQLDLLLPLAERESELLFSQTSLHRTDDRSHLNLGIGTRHFTTEFMIGGNLFYDRDMSRSHSRAGVGLEYWRDSLKLAANGYHRLSGWQTSADFEDYLERPASGWDVRAEAFLPVYPQLGGKLVYEKYYGDEVALFGKDKRQRNPHAFTSGLSYTPIPLVSFDAEHRQGKGSANDSRIGLNVNWQIGKSIDYHLSGDAVASMRSLKGSRYDFVDRNNTIVLEYQKETVISFVTPDSVRGVAGTAVSFATQVDSRHGLERIEWTAPDLVKAGGNIISMGSSHTVQLPDLVRSTRDASANTYILQGVAIDRNGNRSDVQETLVHVDAPTIHAEKSHFEPARSILPADGKSTQELILSVQDIDGNFVNIPASDITLDIISDRGSSSGKVSTVKAISTGKFSLTVTAGTDVEKITLIPAVQGIKLSAAEVVTEDLAQNAALVVTPNVIMADKTEAASLTLSLKNSAEEAMSGQNVSFKVEGVENTLLSAVTENNGVYVAQLTGEKAGIASITPLINGNPASHLSDSVTLRANEATAQFAGAMTVMDNHAVADGVQTNRVQVKVTDAMGNPLADYSVSFSAMNASVESPLKTDKNGIATSVITSKQVGIHNIVAQVEGEGSDISANVVFVSGAVEAEQSSFEASPKEITADGQNVSKLTFTAKDAHNNPVNGLRVTYEHNGSAVIISDATETNGVYVAELRGKSAGTINVTPLVDGKPLGNLSDSVTLIANPATAQFSGDMTVIGNYAIADGSAVNRVQVKVTDESGNVLKNIPVSFYSDNANASVQSSVETDVNGLAIATVTSRMSGDFQVYAEVGNSKRSEMVNFISGAVTAEKSSFEVSPKEITADDQSVSKLTFTAKDAHNNPVNGLRVTFEHNGNTVTISDATETNGVYVADLRGKLAGTVNVTPLVDGKPLGNLSDSVTLIANSATAQFSGDMTVLDNHAIADESAANRVQVKITDELGNALKNIPVRFYSHNANVFAQSPVETDENGFAIAAVRSKKSGDFRVYAEIGNSNRFETVSFISGAVTAEKSSFEASPTEITADGQSISKLTFTAKDAHNNPVNGLRVTFEQNGSTVTISDATETNGVYVVDLRGKIAGTVNVTPLVDSKPLGNLSDSVTLVANSATAQFSGDMAVINNHAVADGSVVNRVQVTVADELGNVLKGIPVSFSSDNVNVTVQSPVETDINGLAIATVTSRTSGDYKVFAKLDKGNSERSETVTFIAGAVSEEKSMFKALPAKITANGEEESELTFTAKDANNNPVSGLSVTFNPNGSSNVVIDAVTENNGVYVSKLRGKVAETVTIIPVVDGKSLSSLSDKVELIADIQTARITEITVDSDNARASGTDKNHVTVTVKDEFNNIVSGAPVEFSVANGATILAGQNTTDQQGKISAEITSENEGTYTVTAKIKGVAGTEKKVTTTFVSDAILSDFIVINDLARADGTAINEVSAKVTDSKGRALINQIVTFSATNGAKTKVPTARTDAEGIATVTLTSEIIGKSTVTASINGSSKAVPVQFSTYVTSLTVTASQTDVSVGDKIQLTVVAKDKNGKTMPNATVTFSRFGATDRKNVSRSDSGQMLFNGLSGIGSVETGTNGSATISVEDPRGIGVESTIKAYFGSIATGDLVNSNEVKLIYRVKTSPSSSYANMWGNMTETVGGARRPILYGENGLTSDYSQNLNNESWAVFKSPTNAKNACGGNKSKMATKTSLLSVNLGNAGWPQWPTYDNPSNPSELMSNAMYILPEGLAGFYTPAVAKNNSLMTLGGVFSPNTTSVAGTGFLATCKV